MILSISNDPFSPTEPSLLLMPASGGFWHCSLQIFSSIVSTEYGKGASSIHGGTSISSSNGSLIFLDRKKKSRKPLGDQITGDSLKQKIIMFPAFWQRKSKGEILLLFIFCIVISFQVSSSKKVTSKNKSTTVAPTLLQVKCRTRKVILLDQNNPNSP